MRLFLVFTGLAAAVLAVWLAFGGAWETRFTLEGSVRWLEGAGSWGWAAGIGLLVGDLLLPVPSTVVMSALGWIYGWLAGGLAASAGLVLSRLLGYAIGRWIHEPTARKLLGNKDFERGHALFARGGGWMVAVSQALPIVPEALSCTAGLVRMPLRRFLVSLACGSLPVGFLFAAVGQLGREQPFWALGFSIVIPAALWAAARKLPLFRESEASEKA